MGLLKGDFAWIWKGMPTAVPSRDAFAYLCGFVSFTCGIGLLWRKSVRIASTVLFAYLLLWMLTVKGYYIVRAPAEEVSYQSCAETAVLVAAAWILFARYNSQSHHRWLAIATGDNGTRIARYLYGLALIAFGLSHFFYVRLTTPLVPAWLPWHSAWAYVTGSTFTAAGIAVLLNVYARLAATLSTLQVGLFIFLVWVPILIGGQASEFRLGEFVVTCAVTAGAWVAADSYRGIPWLAVRYR